MFDQVDVLKDSSEPKWEFDLLDNSVVDADTKECLEKLDDAKKDLVKLKTHQEKKSQVQKQLLVRMEEVEKMSKDKAVEFALIGEVKESPDEIKTQAMAVKVYTFSFSLRSIHYAFTYTT